MVMVTFCLLWRYVILITLEIPTLQLRWLSLRKFCYVNIRNINVNKIECFSVKVSLSEKSKGSNFKENIDVRLRTEC